jgi:hypothetical protein
MRRPSSATDRQAGDRRTWKAAQKRPGLSIAVVTVTAMILFSPRLAGADVVLDWNLTMMATLAGQGPFASARFAAITQLAVFEAVNAITGEYRPYLGTISAPAGSSAEAAAAAAAHGVLRAYFPAKAAALDMALAASLAAIPDGPAKTDGIAIGEAAAAAMVALRADDGSAARSSTRRLLGPDSGS